MSRLGHSLLIISCWAIFGSMAEAQLLKREPTPALPPPLNSENQPILSPIPFNTNAPPKLEGPVLKGPSQTAPQVAQPLQLSPPPGGLIRPAPTNGEPLAADLMPLQPIERTNVRQPKRHSRFQPQPKSEYALAPIQPARRPRRTAPSVTRKVVHAEAAPSDAEYRQRIVQGAPLVPQRQVVSAERAKYQRPTRSTSTTKQNSGTPSLAHARRAVDSSSGNRCPNCGKRRDNTARIAILPGRRFQ